MIAFGAILAGSGCSSTALPSASSLTGEAGSLLRTARGVRVSGAAILQGEAYQVNLIMNSAGDYAGTMNVDGHDFSLKGVHGIMYELVTREIFAAMKLARTLPPSAACATLCGQYLKFPGTHQLTLAGVTTLYDQTTEGKTFGVSLTTFDGEPAYALTGTQDSAGYIAARSPHYLLGIRAGNEHLAFTDWNDIPPITAPSPRQIVQLPRESMSLPSASSTSS
jgi:hypothetical protein